jgi:hypothetical protein
MNLIYGNNLHLDKNMHVRQIFQNRGWGFPTQSLSCAKTYVCLHVKCSLLLIDLTKIMCRQILLELPNIKYRENAFSSSRIVTYGLTDSGLIGAFLQPSAENAHKQIIRSSYHSAAPQICSTSVRKVV